MNGGNHGNPGEIQDEQLKKETSKRRASLEQRIKERSSSASSSMSTSSNSSSEGSSCSSSSTSECSSLSTPEPVPRQSKQRKMSSGFSRNINIILEDEISNDNCETTKSRMMPPGLNLPKPKTSFHRRFSQDHSSMNVNIKRSSSPVRKISLQNNSTINTDR